MDYLNQALGVVGSDLEVPSDWQGQKPYAGNPTHIASSRDPWGEVYAGNPTEYSDAHSRAREATPYAQDRNQAADRVEFDAIKDYYTSPVQQTGRKFTADEQKSVNQAARDVNGMTPEDVAKTANPGGIPNTWASQPAEDPNISAANQILAQNPEAQKAKQQTQVTYAQEPLEKTAEQKQNNIKDKGKNLVGAVANFYGGNWVGAVGNVKNFFSNDGTQEGAGGSPLDSLMGGGKKTPDTATQGINPAAAGQAADATNAAQTASTAQKSGLGGMFGGGGGDANGVMSLLSMFGG